MIEERLNFQSNKQQLNGVKLSHDVKKFKILKKIIGGLGYKLVDKKSLKAERLIDRFLINAEDILKTLIKKNKIKKIIQVGANDGANEDFLFKCFNEDLEAILIEPTEDAFLRLKDNYKSFKKAKCLNVAIDIESKKKEIFTPDKKFYEFYKKKYNDRNVDWLNVLSSFDKQHLVKHGIKKDHIISKIIECKTFLELINTHSYQDLDLLIIDTEGYDCTLVDNFIETINIRPIIIFEWIHSSSNEVEILLKKLKKNNYEFIKHGRDLICYQNHILFD